MSYFYGLDDSRLSSQHRIASVVFDSTSAILTGLPVQATDIIESSQGYATTYNPDGTIGLLHKREERMRKKRELTGQNDNYGVLLSNIVGAQIDPPGPTYEYGITPSGSIVLSLTRYDGNFVLLDNPVAFGSGNYLNTQLPGGSFINCYKYGLFGTVELEVDFEVSRGLFAINAIINIYLSAVLEQ